MDKARIIQRREAIVSVGDTVGYYNNIAVVREITSTFLVLEYDGVRHSVSMEAFATVQGQNFTLDITVEKL